MIRQQINYEPPSVGLPTWSAGGRERGMPTDGLCAELLEVLRAAADRDASDVHLVPGHPPTLRVHGRLVPSGEKGLASEQIQQMAGSVLSPEVFDRFEEVKNADASVSFEHGGRPLRFRANFYLARDGWCACFRHIPNEIPSLEWLGFSQELAERLVAYQDGLVLITGETGAGKSTTLAALIALLRRRREAHILTIEEPIEYIHARDGGGLVTQREVGRDVASFADGLKYGLRQDPDVILVGEIRDRETAQMALTAAETGHLIFSTMHTRDAKGALTRFVDLFPQDSQADVRTQLAMSLRSVVSQQLLPPAEEGQRRVLALEVLHVTPPVQVVIRSGRFEKLESSLQTGVREGMVQLDDDLRRLVRAGRITLETAKAFAHDPKNLTASQSW